MKTSNEVFLLIHDIRSAHNVGSMFRTADAAGVAKIFLSGSTPAPIDRFGRHVKEIAKVALGAEQTLPWERRLDALELITDLKKQKVQIVALEQAENSIDYKKLEIKQPTLLIVGNEVDGLPKEILEACDVVAEIPMKGEKESLNVAVSLGVALFRMLNI